MLTIALASVLLAPQSVADRESGPSIRVELAARSPEPGVSMGWSPKGAKVPLGLTGSGALRGSFELGAYPKRAVELRRSEGSAQHDVLRLDWDGNGTVGDDEVRTCTPRETRGKWWSSFEGEIAVPLAAGDDGRSAGTRSYPISVWYVFDPAEPDAEPALRWSRRGWCEGTFTPPGGEVATLVLAESEMDGRYDGADAWALDHDPAQARRARSRPATGHAWLDGKAWRLAHIDPDGRHVTLVPFDPGMTEEEEQKANDRFAADRTAPRAEKPLAFRHDVDQALADAKATGKRVFLDFETTWCGPCKQMDLMVYTARAVVTAAATADLICVKVDGDERRDLVKRFGVEAYPTLLVLSPEGEVLRREVGYRSVADTARLLGGGE
ncbi:MAG: thioredoxin family protein [Planctomycetota bacterium]|nr:thioredoxin family protein [Planctomycetota bacterium]